MMNVLLLISLSALVFYGGALCTFLRVSMLPGIGGGMVQAAAIGPLYMITATLALIFSLSAGGLCYQHCSAESLVGKIALSAVLCVVSLALTGLAPSFLPAKTISYAFPVVLLVGFIAILYTWRTT